MRITIALVAGLVTLTMVAPLAAAHHNDTDHVAEAPPNPFAPIELYHYYLMIEDQLKAWSQQYPDLFEYKVIGKSVLGLNMFAVKITNKKSTDPPMDQRYRLYFDGSIHSNEQLGMETVMDIAKYLLDGYASDKDAKFIVDHRITYMVPLVNPDGNVRDSRQNVNNVDLNRNFPAGWGGPGSAAKGPKPLSEPETQAIAKYLEEVRPHYSNSFHTGTLMLLHPFGNYASDAKVHSPDHELFTAICQTIQADMNKANGGKTVPCGQIYSTIYPASGTTADYVYDRFGSSSWTFEVDNEQNLYVHTEAKDGPLRQRLGEAWVAVKHAFMNVERYGALLVVKETLPKLRSDRIVAVEVTIENQGMGASNNTVLHLIGADGKSGVDVHLASIAPGANTTVRVPANSAIAAGGALSVDLQYNKTMFKGFADHQVLDLQAVKDGGALVLKQAGGAASAKGADAVKTGGGSPGFDAVLLAVSTLATLFVLVRRRSR
jgi:hypothetical protein